jgi:hypothetical protein
MSTLGGEESLLEYDLFAVLSKARDDGFSGDAARRAFEAAYAQVFKLAKAGRPLGRKSKNDRPYLDEMQRIIAQSGVSRWAAAVEVAKTIPCQERQRKAQAIRLQQEYLKLERRGAIAGAVEVPSQVAGIHDRVKALVQNRVKVSSEVAAAPESAQRQMAKDILAQAVRKIAASPDTLSLFSPRNTSAAIRERLAEAMTAHADDHAEKLIEGWLEK